MTSAEQLLAALALPRSGRIVDLATELSSAIPQGAPDTFAAFRMTPFRLPLAVTSADPPPPFDFSMEIVSGSLHVGTHIDGLAHIHADGRMHGGIATRDAYSDFGWTVGGAETIAPIVCRGVLLDVADALGVDPLEGSHEITVDELKRTIEAQGTAIQQGDAVLVRTGKIAQFRAGSEDYSTVQPGVGPDAAVWLYEQGMRLLGTDTSGTEPHPMPDRSRTTHRELLVERGVHLLEILDLEELAADRLYEFCLVCLPLKIVGATGSWVRPIAMV